MESSLVPRPEARRPLPAIAAFAFYGWCSLLFATSFDYLTGAMFGQALLYFAVAMALGKRASWAGWFAVGIALSGLVVDVVFLSTTDASAEMVVDTVMQAVLLWLAWRAHEGFAAQPSTNQLTGLAPAPIGWTFALAAGVLPPAVMGALMPPLHSCLGGTPHWDSSGTLLLTVLLAAAGLRLVARLRTVGLLALLGGLVTVAFAGSESAVQTWWSYQLGLSSSEGSLAVHPGHLMTFVACAFALAALAPLGPRFVRAAFRR